MKVQAFSFTGVLLICATPLFAGYHDLIKEMEAYTPPQLLQQSSSPTPVAAKEPKAFNLWKKPIEDARNRWSALVENKVPPGTDSSISPSLFKAFNDDNRTLESLKKQFSLQVTRAFIHLRNSSIQGATTRFEASLEGFDQVTQLSEILRQYSAFTSSVMAGVGPMRGSDNIQMKFPYPGVTALKGQVAEENVRIAHLNLEIVRRDTLSQGSIAYWNLLYTHQALGITRDTLNRLDHLESVATTRYGTGKTSYQDVIKIRIGREKLVEQLETLKKQRVNLESELLTLMNLLPGYSLGRPTTTSPDLSLPDLDRLYSLAIEERQELKRLRAIVARMERMVELAETMIQPGFSQNYALYTDQAVLQAGSSRKEPTFETTVSASRGKGLPKNAWFGSGDAYLRETRRKLDALRSDLTDAEARTRLVVLKGWFELDRAGRGRSLYKHRLTGLSQTSLDVSTRGYESGTVSFADVIASYTGWLNVNLASARHNSDVGIARVELERRIGTRLP